MRFFRSVHGRKDWTCGECGCGIENGDNYIQEMKAVESRHVVFRMCFECFYVWDLLEMEGLDVEPGKLKEALRGTDVYLEITPGDTKEPPAAVVKFWSRLKEFGL